MPGSRQAVTVQMNVQRTFRGHDRKLFILEKHE